MQGLLHSMMCQGEFTSALMHVDGLLAKRYPSVYSVSRVTIIFISTVRRDWLPQFNSYRVEASWKLGQWNELEKYLKAVGSGIG